MIAVSCRKATALEDEVKRFDEMCAPSVPGSLCTAGTAGSCRLAGCFGVARSVHHRKPASA
eukprot:6176028-Pleurochrysis_carterae.AAC.2